MCSNTSSSSGAGVSGSGAGDDGDYASVIFKKPKRQRVPKRGPGVAELEKILREQENKNHAGTGQTMKGNVVPIVPDHNINHHFSPPPAPPMTMLHRNGGKNINAISGGTTSGGNIGVRMEGSGLIFPEQAPLPTVWSSCESSIYEEGPKIPAGYPFSTNFPSGSSDRQMLHSPLVPQTKHSHQYPPPTINLFPNSGSFSSSENNPSAGFCVHLEPPSNQRSSASHHNYSFLPEEDKIVGTKRPKTFPIENNSGPPIFQCQVSSPFSHMHTLDQSPSSCNHITTFNLKPDGTVPRDHAKKFIADHGTSDGNCFLLGSQPAPSQLHQDSHQEFSKYSSLPFQESMEGSQSQQKKKPFYSFLIPEEQTAAAGEEEITLSLSSGRAGTRETVDLSLKL